MTSSDAGTLVSIVIPVHNAAPFICEALASTYAQDGPAIEIIVVDDGSTDGSLEVARSRHPGIRAIRQANAGIGAARNRGVEAARGEYLAFLDADDRWPAGRLARLMAARQTLKDPAAIFGHVRHFLCPSLQEATRRRLHCPAGTAPGFLAGAMLLRLEDFRRVGPFEEDLRVGEFISWFARACDAGLAYSVIEDVVLERRIHDTNHTLSRRESDYARLLKRILDRRRSRPR